MTARRGMTIVEVLVTVGVIGVLAGVLMPVLTHGRAAGRSTRCLGNLRQMAMAAQVYSTWEDAFPPAVWYENEGVHTTFAWDWVQTTAGEPIGPGPLWSFADDPGTVMQCPEYRGRTNFADPYTGYGYNASYIGDEESWTISGIGEVRRGVPPHACARSTTCAMFGCAGRAGGGTHKFLRAPSNERDGLDLPTLYSGGFAFRHSGATNVAFIDGHVATRTQMYEGVHATADLLDTFMGFPANGFLSEDDAAYDPR